jgi:hypothetical protein
MICSRFCRALIKDMTAAEARQIASEAVEEHLNSAWTMIPADLMELHEALRRNDYKEVVAEVSAALDRSKDTTGVIEASPVAKILSGRKVQSSAEWASGNSRFVSQLVTNTNFEEDALAMPRMVLDFLTDTDTGMGWKVSRKRFVQRLRARFQMEAVILLDVGDGELQFMDYGQFFHSMLRFYKRATIDQVAEILREHIGEILPGIRSADVDRGVLDRAAARLVQSTDGRKAQYTWMRETLSSHMAEWVKEAVS